MDKRPDYLNTTIYLEVAIKEASFIYAHIFPNTKLIFKNKPVSKFNRIWIFLICEPVLIGGARHSQLQYSPLLPQPHQASGAPWNIALGLWDLLPTRVFTDLSQACSPSWWLWIQEWPTLGGPKVWPPHDMPCPLLLLIHLPRFPEVAEGWKETCSPCALSISVSCLAPSTGLDPLRHPHGVTSWFTNRVAGIPIWGWGAAGPLVLSWPEAGVSEGVRMRERTNLIVEELAICPVPVKVMRESDWNLLYLLLNTDSVKN